ncbi:hypothetical protein KCP77_20590 [Salmonella enterica subsp. enterica]|nr:hypothetical protein KCP77_20590 [Salmonella enterica subsp. enterica]
MNRKSPRRGSPGYPAVRFSAGARLPFTVSHSSINAPPSLYPVCRCYCPDRSLCDDGRYKAKPHHDMVNCAGIAQVFSPVGHFESISKRALD